MAEMKFFLCISLVLLGKSGRGVTESSADRGDYEADIYSDEYYDNYTTTFEPSAFPELDKHRTTLNVLFGSEEKGEKAVFDLLNTKPNYWILDLIQFSIEQKVGTGATMNATQRSEVDVILNLLERKKKDLFTQIRFDKAFFDNLNSTRPVFDCALGRNGTDINFNKVETSFHLSTWACDMSFPELWSDLVNTEYTGKKCTLQDTLHALVHIENASNSRKPNNVGYNQETLDLKFDLLYTISKERHLNFITNVLCNVSQTPMAECQKLNKVLCGIPVTYSMVSEFTKNLEVSTKSSTSAATDVIALLEVQQELGSIANCLVNPNPLHRTSQDASAAQSMLESYIGIMDTVIGNSSVDVWKQTSWNDTRQQFQQILLSNEEYVGFASDMILLQKRSKEEVNKNTLSVQMQQVADMKEKVGFSFNDAEIWTEELDSIGLEKSNLNVYALYYKSWREMLKEVGGSSASAVAVEEIGSNKTNQRYFVGKGGIVSLSTRSQQKKKSVPVFYKMKFSDDNLSPGEDGLQGTHRCLSCGYLDIDTYTWKSVGCRATEVDDVGLTCKCNHTTNFAAFMMPTDRLFNTSEEQELWLNIIQYVGSIVSVICLFASFIVFCIVRKAVKTDRLKAHINLVVSLFFVHLIQLVADVAVSNNIACEIVTVTTHFFLLSSFMFMLVEGIFLYRYVIQVFVHSRMDNRSWMYLIGWGIPVVIVAITAGYGLPNDIYIEKKTIINTCPDGQILYPPQELEYSLCWLSWSSGMIWAFIAPAIVVILFNLIILCRVVRVLLQSFSRSKGMQPFKPTYHSQANRSNQTKQSASFPMSSTVSETKFSEHSITAHTEDPSSHPDSLHGNVITHNGSYSKSHSPSQSYSQHNVLDRSREEFASGPGNKHFLSDVRKAIRGAAVLLPLLGIPWICGTLAYTSYALTVIFVLLNSVQGLAIFLVYCVFNGEVNRAFRRYLQLRQMKSYSSRGRASSTSSLKNTMSKGLLRSWRRRSTAVSTLSNHV